MTAADLNKASRIQLPEEFRSPLQNGPGRRAVEELGRRIAGDVYLPGQAIPMEQELAASLGVSRTTLRDAVKVLSGKGLLRTARRYGTRVRPVSEWNLLDADLIGWHDAMHPRLARIYAETTELRSIIEPQSAALAALRAKPEQIARIEEGANGLRTDELGLQELFDADLLFHTAILEATGNAIMGQLRSLIAVTLRVSFEYGIGSPKNRILDQSAHLAVARAIAARDAQAAHDAMDKMLALNRSISLPQSSRIELYSD